MLEQFSWWTPVAVFVVAFLVNYPWELAESPLYEGMENFSVVWWHCFKASLGDGLLVQVIYATGWVVLQQHRWFVQPGARGYLLIVTMGLVIGISVEWMAVYIAGRWAYTPQMPLIAGLGVGMVPVVQMLVLPPLIFRVVAMLLSRLERGTEVARTVRK